jgi:hypothetical protein
VSARVLVLAFILGLGIVGADEFKRGNFPPRPTRFNSVVLIFVVLAVVAVPAPALAAAFGIGIDIALLLRSAAGAPSQASSGSQQSAGGQPLSQVPVLFGNSQVSS